MNPLHHAIALRVIRSGAKGFNTEGSHEIRPQDRGKLAALIGGDVLWSTEARDPVADQGLSTVRGRGSGQGDCLQPPRMPVNDGEEVCEALRLRQGPNQVQMKAEETVVRERAAHQGRVHMAYNFGSLATLT